MPLYSAYLYINNSSFSKYIINQLFQQYSTVLVSVTVFNRLYWPIICIESNLNFPPILLTSNQIESITTNPYFHFYIYRRRSTYLYLFTECPKIYHKPVLHLLKADAVQIFSQVWNTQYYLYV